MYWHRFIHSLFIHYGDLYSAPSRLLLRSTPDPCTTKKKSFETRVDWCFELRSDFLIGSYQMFHSYVQWMWMLVYGWYLWHSIQIIVITFFIFLYFFDFPLICLLIKDVLRWPRQLFCLSSWDLLYSIESTWTLQVLRCLTPLCLTPLTAPLSTRFNGRNFLAMFKRHTSVLINSCVRFVLVHP